MSTIWVWAIEKTHSFNRGEDCVKKLETNN